MRIVLRADAKSKTTRDTKKTKTFVLVFDFVSSMLNLCQLCTLACVEQHTQSARTAVAGNNATCSGDIDVFEMIQLA